MSIVFWKDLLPDQRGSETATLCVNLLKNRLDGKISEAEFEKELKYVSIQDGCLQDMHYKEAPEKSIEVQKATEALESEKQNLRANEFLDMGAFGKAHPCLMDYSNKVDGIARTNQRNANTLEENIAFFKQLGDQVATMKSQEALNTFPRSIWIGSNCIWKKK